MAKYRLIFLGTPEIAVPCLKKLLDLPEIEVKGVITQPDRPAGRSLKMQACPVKIAAVEAGLEVISPETVKSVEVTNWVQSRNPDSAVVVAFGQILPLDFLNFFPKKSVNVHASLLPRWRGAGPIQRAIMEGDSETGCALQVIVPKLDAGPIIGARKFALPSQMNAYELYEKMKQVAPELLTDDYLEFLKGEIEPKEQDESQVTIAKKIKKEEGLINWNESAEILDRKIRGLWMWPGSWSTRDQKTLKVWKSQPVQGKASPGLIFEVRENSILVGCGEGLLEIFEVQPESRAKMAMSEYLKGYPLKKGDSLGT